MAKNITDARLAKLAQLMGIEIKHGWKTQLAEKLNRDKGNLSTWVQRDAIPDDFIQNLEKKGIPKEDWFDISVTKWTFDSFSGDGAVGIRTRAIEMLLEIFDSGNQNLINAILANLEAFSGAVRNEKRQKQEIEDLKRRIEALERSRAELREIPEPESNAA